jgi:hypothetical protein
VDHTKFRTTIKFSKQKMIYTATAYRPGAQHVGAPNIIQQHASTSLNLRPDLPKATAIEEIGAPSIRFQQHALRDPPAILSTGRANN